MKKVVVAVVVLSIAVLSFLGRGKVRKVAVRRSGLTG